MKDNYTVEEARKINIKMMHGFNSGDKILSRYGSTYVTFIITRISYQGGDKWAKFRIINTHTNEEEDVYINEILCELEGALLQKHLDKNLLKNNKVKNN